MLRSLNMDCGLFCGTLIRHGTRRRQLLTNNCLGWLWFALFSAIQDTGRNGWKRRIREAFRQHREHLPAGFDFVIRPRRGAVPDYPAIAASLPRLLSRLAGRLSQGMS